MTTTERIFKQIKTSESNPIYSGWFDTDKGNFYWFVDEQAWSCRDDRISIEYPTIWYQPIASVIGKEMPKIDKDTLRMAIDFGADLEAGVIQMDWKKYETYVDMFLDRPKDLTPKTDTTDGE